MYVGLHKSFGILSSFGEESMLHSHFEFNGWEEVKPKLTITKWVNVYKEARKGVFSLSLGCNYGNTKQEAMNFGRNRDGYLDTIEITYTEKES